LPGPFAASVGCFPAADGDDLFLASLSNFSAHAFASVKGILERDCFCALTAEGTLCRGMLYTHATTDLAAHMRVADLAAYAARFAAHLVERARVADSELEPIPIQGGVLAQRRRAAHGE